MFRLSMSKPTDVYSMDCRGAVASVRDSYTDNPSSIPVLLVVASW